MNEISLQTASDEELTNLLTQALLRYVAGVFAGLAHDPSTGPAPWTLGLDENGEIIMKPGENGIYYAFDEAALFEKADCDADTFVRMRTNLIADWLAEDSAARDFRLWLAKKNGFPSSNRPRG